MELKSLNGFEKLNLEEEEDNVRELVYNLSIILYKTFENE